MCWGSVCVVVSQHRGGGGRTLGHHTLTPLSSPNTYLQVTSHCGLLWHRSLSPTTLPTMWPSQLRAACAIMLNGSHIFESAKIFLFTAGCCVSHTIWPSPIPSVTIHGSVLTFSHLQWIYTGMKNLSTQHWVAGGLLNMGILIHVLLHDNLLFSSRWQGCYLWTYSMAIIIVGCWRYCWRSVCGGIYWLL